MSIRKTRNKRTGFYAAFIAAAAICLFGGAGPGNAELPKVPYGLETNAAIYPRALYDFFHKNLVSKINGDPFTSPTFQPGHGVMMAGTANPGIATLEEVTAMIRSLPTNYMRWDYVACGTSYSGVESEDFGPEKNFAMPLVVFSKPPVFEPEELRALNKPIFYMHGSVHANEASAAESVFMLMQKLAVDEFKLLDRISVIVLPRYNNDGAWRMQRGTNMARGLDNVDQNRDHTMFISPQTRILNTVLNRYRPHMGVDPHEMGYTLNGAERYYASGIRGTGEMTVYSVLGPNYDPDGSTVSIDNALYQYSLYNPIDLGNKFWNQPPEMHDRNDALREYVVNKLWDEHGIYSYPYAFGAGTASLSWRDADVSVLSGDGKSYAFPGQIQERVMAFECTPDEGYGDGALGLKGTIELCAEVPAARIHADGYKARTYTHYLGIRYMMQYLAENAKTFMTEIPAIRDTMAADRSDLALWSVQQPRSVSNKVLRLNGTRDTAEVIDVTVPFQFDNANNLPGVSVTRPCAYIIDGEIINDGRKINAELAAFRIAYSGIPVMRLTEPATLQVEINRVDDIGALNDRSGANYPAAMPDRDANGAFRTTPEMSAWKPSDADQYWLGAYDTQGSFGIQTHRIREATKRVETRTFPAGTCVVPINHMSGLHAALMLEVLGKRNMGNSYYRTKDIEYGPSGQHKHYEYYFPVETGKDFPAYRYMKNVDDLPLERVYTEQAFLRNANFGEGYPVSVGTLTAKGYELPDGISAIDFGYHFKAEGIGVTSAHPQATELDLHLPGEYDGVKLGVWYIYNWEADSFETLPDERVKTSATSGARYAELTSPYISSQSEVIAIARGSASSSDDGGCNAGAGFSVFSIFIIFFIFSVSSISPTRGGMNRL